MGLHPFKIYFKYVGGGSSAPAWSLFGGDREKTKEYNDKMKKGDENRILFAMIISILDIFIKTPLHGGFCSIKPVRQ